MTPIVLSARLRRRTPTCLAAIATCLAMAGDARASGRPSGRVVVTRSEGASSCPDSEALQAAVDRAGILDSSSASSGALSSDSEGSPDAGPSAPRKLLSLEVAFGRTKSGYVAAVQVPGRRTKRTLASAVASCSGLADAVVVAINVMLDGMGDEPAGDSPDQSQVPASPPATKSDAHSTPGAVPWPPLPPDEDGAKPAHDGEDSDMPHRTAPNIVFVEALGAGLASSVNYERFFGDDASVRIGFSYQRGTGAQPVENSAGIIVAWPKQTQFSLPLLANYYCFGPNHDFHFGGGVTFFYRTGLLEDGWVTGFNESFAEEKRFNMTVDAVIGYRYVPRGGGPTIGVDAMLVVNTVAIAPWTGANVGWAF
jgi:hypothetical protein